VSDNIRHESTPRKAGRGFLRALRALLGPRNVARTAESLKVLGEEYRAGRDEAEPEEPPPRRISYRELRSEPGCPEEP